MMTADPDDRSTDPSAPLLDRHERLTVGIVVDRRKAKSPWADYVWQPVEALLNVPPLAPWSVMRESEEVTRFFAGPFTMELIPRETISYRENLLSERPGIYVVLRPDPAARHGMRLEFVTPSPSDAEAYLAGGEDVIDRVPMPQPVQDWLAAYVEAYHVEETFKKRRRGRDKPGARRLS